MILRILGSACMLCASFSYMISRSRDEKYRLDALRCALECIRHVETKIRLFDTPTPDLLSDFHYKGHFDQMQDIKNCAECLTPYMADEDKEVFLHFCTSLGSTYKDDAVQMCEYAQMRLEKSYRRVEEEYPARKRLYSSLPVLIACAVLVLLW